MLDKVIRIVGALRDNARRRTDYQLDRAKIAEALSALEHEVRFLRKRVDRLPDHLDLP